MGHARFRSVRERMLRPCDAGDGGTGAAPALKLGLRRHKSPELPPKLPPGRTRKAFATAPAD